MAYVGRGIDNISNASLLDAITFTNSAGPYNLEQGSAAFTPVSVQALVISVDGVIQSPDSYTISAATITFGVSMASTLTNDFIVHNGVGLITEPSDGSVTAAKLATDAVETAKIKDLNVTAGKLAATQDLSTKTITLPATVAGLGTGIDVTSQITGVVPTANLGSGSASASTYLAGNQTYQTITEYDDDAVQNDIAILALHQATNANAAKYNLSNTNVDVFQDSTGVASFTDCARDSGGEYISTIGGDADIVLLMHMELATLEDTGPSNITPTIGSGAGTTRSSAQAKFGTYSCYNTGAANCFANYEGLGTPVGTGDFTLDMWVRPDDVSALNRLWSIGNTAVPAAANDGNGSVVSSYYIGTSYNFMSRIDTDSSWSFTGTTLVNNTWAHVAYQRTSGTSYAWLNGVVQGTSSTHITGRNMESYSSGGYTAGANLSLFARAGSSTEIVDGYIDEVRYCSASKYTGGVGFTPETSAYPDPLFNATGNFVSTATTANSAVTSMGIVITYKNESGAAILNTDIVAQVSADGGSNYSTVTLAAAGTFSTGVLQAVANDVTVTSGTSIQYKISFANQSSGVKETRVTGVSLMY